MSGERISRLKAVGFVWDKQEAAWEEGFARLEAFVDREGHAHVPTGYLEDGYTLGNWCVRQRAVSKRGDLSEERIARLEAVGFVWDELEAAWEEGYTNLEVFVDREGHTHVPDSHVESGYKLGSWCAHQRGSYKKGSLSGERISRLKAVGFVWDKPEAAWEERFASLEAFVDREGHTHVPNSHVESGYGLGRWCGRQRTSYAKGSLSERRVERLESLPGWIWDARSGP